MQAIICDIDGTLADTSHRKHHLEKKPKDWDSWNSMMEYDQPIYPVIQTVRLMSLYNTVILCTGRQEKHRYETIVWLARHNVKWHLLHMRKTGDYRDDTVVKEEMLDSILSQNYQVSVVIDDRQKVVNMWRRRGLTCFQCAPGDF